jgi:hypothetical protein
VQVQLALTVLLSVFPHAFVIPAISPPHLSIAMSQIILEIPLEKIPRGPCENSFPAFLIVKVIALEFIAFLVLPTSVAISKPILKYPSEFGPRVPGIESVALRLAVNILPLELVPIIEHFLALAILIRVSELSIIDTASALIDPLPIRLPVFPLTLIRLPMRGAPLTLPVPQSVHLWSECYPLAFVEISVLPHEAAFALGPVVGEKALVEAAFGVGLDACPVL